MTRSPDQDIAEHFNEGIDCCAPRRDASKRPGIGLARLLEKELRAVGVKGRTVLDLGCGRGEMSLELIREGASTALGIDLSADAIEYAQRIATEDGLSDRLEFRIGNAATMHLPSKDVVVHHRVICCYPDVSVLLTNSISAAKSIYAFSMPRSRGPWGLIARIELEFENVLHRLKRRGFRAHVHDERLIDAALTKAGFKMCGRSNRRAWFVAAYVKS